ncbi:hypothetical protein RND81_01G120200 [Saponaria officinalis]|uniref:Disease resistance R13L4/SHOC-2-like LRR domain-containing protein n=1 Tax=Saponaria officinalis TaxID=3572 RepID=A0AAW1NEK4_SAPOF
MDRVLNYNKIVLSGIYSSFLGFYFFTSYDYSLSLFQDGPKLKDATVVPNYRKIMNAAPKSTVSAAVSGQQLLPSKSTTQRWMLTGVVALSHSHLNAIPPEVWSCGSSARVLDLSNNSISHIPIDIGCFTSIHKLILSANEITDDSLCWEGLAQLKTLSYLSLNQNLLTYLPASLGALTALEQLHVSGNKVSSLPIEIGHLTRLEILKVNNNRLSIIPPVIGDCSSLTEIDVSSNVLVELPETMSSLQNLKSLRLCNNGLKSLPSSIFKKCVKLSTLDLHGTQITMDMLREVEGWEEFDERRRLKYQKQLDFRAGGSAEFDEGADQN